MRRLCLLPVCLLACAPAAPKPVQRITPIGPAENTAEPPSRRAAAPAPATPRLQIALGNSSACVRDRGSLHCWNRETPPKLPITKEVPPVRGLSDVSDVGIGYAHTCALARGRVYCWGENEHGQLGAGLADLRRAEPVRVPGIEAAQALAVGLWHSCALLEGGSVTCWGRNSSGETGSDVEYASDARELVVPEPVPGLARVSALGAGRDQTCALASGIWSCFGRSHLGSQRSARGGSHNEPWPVPELATALALSLHDETACGVFEGGSVSCWGSGTFSLFTNRPLGDGSLLPVEVADAVQVAAGALHACAITRRGRVVCWGVDANGRLGRGRVIEGYEPNGPEEVARLSDVTSLELDVMGTCAVTSKNELWCWGHPPHLPYDRSRPVVSPEKVPLR